MNCSMKNILLISTIYPVPEGNRGTAVCHFFTREWCRMGYNVRVVHIQAVYPRAFYWIARLFRNKIAAKTGAVVYTHRDKSVVRYVIDNVPIIRIPVFKPIPHGRFSSEAILKTVDEILIDNQNNNFTPDVIIGHFANPQLELLNKLKVAYVNPKTCIVLHGEIEIMRKVYGKKLNELVNGIDMWGFRCKALINEFSTVVGELDNPFVCYSGIPSKYLIKNNTHQYDRPLHRFLYVGEMIERKFPEKIIDALVKVYPQKDYELHYVGSGSQLDVVKLKIKEYNLQNQVKLLGWIPRDQIIEEYDNADCLIMISEGEAYGLVYLEAMARGCLTIASIGEGFDGVIKDGKNGFLCEAGNADDLAAKIIQINAVSFEQRMNVSQEAIMTAKSLTDEKAAERYINDILQRM